MIQEITDLIFDLIGVGIFGATRFRWVKTR